MLTKPSNSVKRFSLRDVTKNPLTTLAELQTNWEKVPEGRLSLQQTINQSFMATYPARSVSSVKYAISSPGVCGGKEIP